MNFRYLRGIFISPKSRSISRARLTSLLQASLERHRFTTENAKSLARQLVDAEVMGQSAVGLVHAFDYLASAKRGQINGSATPIVAQPAPSIVVVDGQGGLPQRGFDAAFKLVCETANQQGTALFLHRNATLCGALGTYAVRLAEAGLFALVATNGPALMGGSGTTAPVFSTNPLAFAAPGPNGPEVLVDQSTSATAFVNVRQAAHDGNEIPLGWAVDAEGRPTSDPLAAMEGMLLPFGGTKGSNVAFLVELLAAGLTDGNWSIDAPPFGKGDLSPATGLFILAIAPDQIDPKLRSRMSEHLNALADAYGFYLPGRVKIAARRAADSMLSVDVDILEQLKRAVYEH